MPEKGISNAQILSHNQAAAQVMQKHGIPINDLYRAIEPQLDQLQRPSDVHFYEEGYDLLRKKVAECLWEQIELQGGPVNAKERTAPLTEEEGISRVKMTPEIIQ